MNAKRNWPLVAVLSGIALYLVLFYATKLPGLKGIDGEPLRRAVFLLYLLAPENLVSQWFGADGDFAIADRLPLLTAGGGIVAYAFTLGWMLLVLGRVDRWLNRLETFVFSTAVGLNVVSTYVLLAGLLGLLGNRLLFALPAALTLAAAGWLRFGRRTKPSGTSTDSPSPSAKTAPPSRPEDGDADGLSPGWLWLAAPFVLVMLLGGMLPPIEYDVREYHLQAPKEFFAAGQIGFLPHNAYGNTALGTEMLSLLGMVIAGDWWLGALIGKTVIAVYAPLTALGLLAAGKRFFRREVGIVAALLYATTPWIVQLSTIGFVEGASGLYLLMTLYALLLWKRSPKRPACLLLLAGYLAGSAVSCKYPAVLFVVVPLTAWLSAILFARPKAVGRAKATATLGIFFLAIAVGCGAWFGKNLVLTGNPTYPLMYKLFDGKTWTAEKARMWNHVHQPTDFSTAALKHDLVHVLLGSAWLSPLLVPLAVLAFLRFRSGEGETQPRERRLALGLAAYFAFIIVAWWCLALRSADRHWIHGLPLLALLAGVGACWTRERPWPWTLRGLLIFAAAANFVVAASGACGYNRYFAPLAELRSIPERVDGWHRYFNQHPTDGVLLLVGEAQVFDIEVPILYNVWVDDSIFERLVRDPTTGKLRPADEIRAAFAQENVSRVYVHWGEIARYRDTGYGSMDFVQPSIFERLVAEGVLQPIPPPEGLQEHPGRAYRVTGLIDP